MTYTPNFRDPRVKKKCLKALSFTGFRLECKPHLIMMVYHMLNICDRQIT
jgi:hypothetical protein